MTRQKTFKRQVRARMEKTGESYTAARRMLIADGKPPDAEPEAPAFELPQSEERVAAATGHGWQHWLRLLDDWGAARRPHREIARHLIDEHGVAGWWAQTVTLGYERARGRRAPGQRVDGFAARGSKTIAVPVERLFEAFSDDALRERWLPAAPLRLRTATAPRTARYDWEDGSTRVIVGFESLGDAKSRVAVEHERLPDAATADEMKAYWRQHLASLKPLLEAEAGGR